MNDCVICAYSVQSSGRVFTFLFILAHCAILPPPILVLIASAEVDIDMRLGAGISALRLVISTSSYYNHFPFEISPLAICNNLSN